MTTKNLTNSTASTGQSIAKLFAVGTLATGAVAAISVAPARAVIIAPGSNLSFNDGVALATGSSITTAGGTFSANFTTGGNTLVTSATGTAPDTFGGLIPGVTPTTSVPKAVTPSTGNFNYTAVDSGNNFTAILTNNLDFDFGGSIGKLTFGVGSTFAGKYLASSAPAVPFGKSFLSFTNGSVSFLNNSQTTSNFAPINFGFNVDNTRLNNPVPGGSYDVSVTAVPEPFTVIGTMLGGAVAMRMRKRLKAENKL